VIHVRSFSKSHGPDLRLAAVSGPQAMLAPVRHARALGQGWSSRLLQRVLAALLRDEESSRLVNRARAEYARRRELVVTRLAELGVDVPGTDGLNIWVPVRDEAAAVLRLASQGIAVTPGSPFSVQPPAGPEGHVRVTTGLVRDGHDSLAELIADAARAGAWTAQHR
jgi:DNA-binding transcriptional MocR family regulator